MSGFEPSLVPVGPTIHQPPRGHRRLVETMRAHLGDLPRLGIVPKPGCDVCGKSGATEVDRGEVRAGIAGWIQWLCAGCERRFALKRAA